jgi:hypothetical protein
MNKSLIRDKRQIKEIKMRIESLEKRGLHNGIPYYIDQKVINDDLLENEKFLNGWEKGYNECIKDNEVIIKILRENEKFYNDFLELCEKHNIKKDVL